MEDNKKEFIGLLCNIYLVFILAVLPLYTKGSYYLIGDRKYFMFRNVSAMCIGMWAVLLVFSKNVKIRVSFVDCAMLAYAAAVIVSTLLSSDKVTAWSGQGGWYMGAMSQLIFVGIYFMISGGYNGQAYPVYAGEAVLFYVVMLGFLNRFGMDLLGLFKTFNEHDWEYGHMLSTVGNINWTCSYIGIAAAFPIAAYMYSEREMKKILTFIISVSSLSMLLLNGSDTGIIFFVIYIILCLTVGFFPLYRARLDRFFKKGILLAASTFVLTAVIGHAMILTGNLNRIPDDSPIQGKMGSIGWWILAAVFFGIYFILGKLHKKPAMKVIKGITVLLAASIFAAGIYYVRGTVFDENWANGRGTLWKRAIEMFLKAPILQKLIGIGPDCYSAYWNEVRYTNAHNEWLTQLVNIGLIGTLAYGAIFAAALKRYRGMLMGLMAISIYIANSFFSFSQVMNTPFLFIILGLCENKLMKQSEI